MNLELNLLVEFVLLGAITIELLFLSKSFVNHAKLEKKMDEHIKRLEEHLEQLDRHMLKLLK